MNESKNELPEIFVLSEQGSIITEIKQLDGTWIRTVLVFDPREDLSVKQCPRHYQPEGILTSHLLPDSVHEYQGHVAVLSKKVHDLLGEIKEHLREVHQIVAEHGVSTEEFDSSTVR